MVERVTVERLGVRGDGVAATPTGPVFVPGALPGERITVQRDGSRGHLLEVEAPSPKRVEPFCPYFGSCGGCAIQHLETTSYQAWKRELVAGALDQAQLETELAPLVDAHGDGRRRLTLHARSVKGAVQVGYMASRSHHLVAIDHCPIAAPALRQSPPLARSLAEALLPSRKPLDVQLTATDTGLDVDLRGHGPVSDEQRLSLVGLARQHDLARLALHGEVLIENRPPLVTMGRARVAVPPGAFLQATQRGEEILGQLVVDACRGAKRIADLFAGCGPFALRLAEQAEIHAVETDRAALAALERAGRAAPGLRRIATEPRDLFRRPLLAPELHSLGAVVMDPPRAGAEAQARQLALADVPLVVSVSCDPGTFARDAAILVAAGYRLERVIPVDQFKHSPHVELVGILRREPRSTRRPARR